MVAWYPIFWSNLLNLRKQWRRFFTSGLLKPFFYLMIFNLGIGRRVAIPGTDYLHFMVPGLLTMIVVNHSFTDIVAWFTVRKNSLRILDFYLMSPIGIWSFLLGHILSNVAKCFVGAVLLLIITTSFAVQLKLSIAFFLVIACLSFIFSALAVIVSILAKGEKDTIAFSTLVMTPMTFLCGTFFPLERLPLFLQKIAWCTPLTPGVYTLRSLALGGHPDNYLWIFIFFWVLATFLLAGYCLSREEA